MSDEKKPFELVSINKKKQPEVKEEVIIFHLKFKDGSTMDVVGDTLDTSYMPMMGIVRFDNGDAMLVAAVNFNEVLVINVEYC
jgi:hypothetical protein